MMTTDTCWQKNVTADMIVKRFQSDEVCYDTESSEISKFYAAKCVFVTGGTGFLGKLLLEKLLRASPDIATIFMLVRAKKGKDAHTRIDEIFNDVVFQKLSKLQPKFRHKIVLVGGDVSLPGLGMSIEDRQLVTEKVSIFIHSAATVKFNEKLNLAIDINVKGTMEMLTLAKECKHVDSFVHISTAFSHCPRKVIGENFYDVPYDADRIIQICNATPSQVLDKVTPDLLGEWPNTYVFTKAIAEDCIRISANKLPVCIVRPAIVTATHKEPIRSWNSNINGATGIIVASGLGILRAVNIDKNKTAEIIPGDMVVNCILSAGYMTATERKTEIPVYNYVSSTQNNIKWEKFMELNRRYGVLTPTIKCFWISTQALIKNRALYNIYISLFHIIPGMFMDLGLLVIGKKPQMISVYKKIHNFRDTIQYFSTIDWTFRNDNTQALFERLSEADKKLYFFDISKLNWDDYFSTHCLGLRTFIIKDELSTIPQAIKRYFRLRLVHNALKFIGLAILLRVVYGLVSYLFL